MLFESLIIVRLASVVLGDTAMLSSAEKKSVQVGESLTIPCPLSIPGGSVQWLQNGVAIVLDPSAPRRRQWAVGAGGEAALAIVSARPSDAGRWECQELAADGTVKNVADVMELAVGNPPSLDSSSDPYLELEGHRLLHQAQVTTREPQVLFLHCVVNRANPPVRIVHWYIGEENVTSWSELFVEFVAEEDAYESRSVLRMNASRHLHGKDLVCRVQHLSWLQAAAVSTSLNVLYDPSFSISRDPGFGFPITEGMRVSLRCEVDANPPSPPVWVRDDGPIGVPQNSLGFLNFSSIERRHSGWYRCTTHHEFGFFASFGFFLNVRNSDLPTFAAAGGIGSRCPADGHPEVTAVNKSLLALVGQSALLAGQLCSDTRLTRIMWILKDMVLNPGDIRHPYIAHNLSSTEVPDCYLASLEFLHVGLDDFGEVLLLARNSYGTSDASIFLNVTSASSLSSSTSLTGCRRHLLLVAFVSCLLGILSTLHHDGS